MDKDYFQQINFNKNWSESDWERYFEAHEAYRLSRRADQVRKHPMDKIRFVKGEDDVTAFEPILRAYGFDMGPAILEQIRTRPFAGDKDPFADTAPPASAPAHFWSEGAPLASLPLYRDACRFAIAAAKEVDRTFKRRDAAFRKSHEAEFANLRFHANWIAINIAEGHRFGYTPDRILGNVAKIRRAIRHADDCVSSINRISRRTRSQRLRRELFAFSAQLRNALYLWVDELRERTA